MNIHEVMKGLSHRNPLYRNEAEFREALAQYIRQLHPSARVETNARGHFGQLNAVDVLVDISGNLYLIQLMYKTTRLEVLVDGVEYGLKHHGANDYGRYDYLLDIERLEKVQRTGKPRQYAYAILLTNDHLYWNPPRKANSIDAEFKIHEGITKTGHIQWADHAGEGSTSGREVPIRLEESYRMSWNPYSQVGNGRNGTFCYLLTEVKAKLSSESVASTDKQTRVSYPSLHSQNMPVRKDQDNRASYNDQIAISTLRTEPADELIRKLVQKPSRELSDEMVQEKLPYGSGYIYIASSEEDPSMIKMGMTSKEPQTRVRELNTSGVAYPLVLRAAYLVSDVRKSEWLVHQYYSNVRLRQDREFFRIPLEQVLAEVPALLTKYNQLTVKAEEINYGKSATNGFDESEHYVRGNEDDRIMLGGMNRNKLLILAFVFIIVFFIIWIW